MSMLALSGMVGVREALHCCGGKIPYTESGTHSALSFYHWSADTYEI
jgi:hypothetical protein